jgi:hypothetical protein
MGENWNIFYQIRETPALTRLYSDFHTLLAGRTYPLSIAETPLGALSYCFSSEPSVKKYFQQFVEADQFRILEEIAERYRNHKIALEDLIDITNRPAQEPE